jgi:hypothetical protein
MFREGRSNDQAHAVERWREAASLVSARWRLFLESSAESRQFAFAAYVAALDAEEVAADAVAARHRSHSTDQLVRAA